MAFNINILSQLQVDQNTSAGQINKVINSRAFRDQLNAVKVGLTASLTQADIKSFSRSVSSALDNEAVVKVQVGIDQKQAVRQINASLTEAAKNLKSIKVDIDARVDKKTLEDQLNSKNNSNSGNTSINPTKQVTEELGKQNRLEQEINRNKNQGLNVEQRKAQLSREVRTQLTYQKQDIVNISKQYSSLSAFSKDMARQFKESGYEIGQVRTETHNLSNGLKGATLEVKKYNAELKNTKTLTIEARQNADGSFTPTRTRQRDSSDAQHTQDQHRAIAAIEKRIAVNERAIAQGSHIESSLRKQNAALREKARAEDLSLRSVNTMIRSQEKSVNAANQERRARQMQIDMVHRHTKAMQQNARYIDRGGMGNLLQQLQRVNVASSNALPQLQNLQSRMNGYVNQAAQATRSQMGIIENFNNAMLKFPIWMGASTLFFGAIRSARTFISTIVEIDSKMITLQKVMSDSANMDEVFNNATRAAERFGQTISDVLDAYAEFARQGYEGVDLSNFGDAALITSNVGEMTAQAASEFLTASAAQWNLQSQEAMGAVDSWNEISNNYATTMEKLGEGQAKAGATAKAMGLDFDETNAIIGALTAQTKQSGSEIGNFIKSAFPRMYAGAGRSVFEDLGIAMENANGETKNAITLLREVSHAMDGLSQADQADAIRGLGGVWHYQRMQVLLETLKDTNGLYDQMLDSSRNSVGSAAAENAIYMESMEARINKAKVAIEQFALALGEAFLDAGIIEFLTNFTDFLSLLTKGFTDLSPAVRNIGFGIFIASLASMSKGVRDFYGTLGGLLGRFKDVQKQARNTANAMNIMNSSNSVSVGVTATPDLKNAQGDLNKRAQSTMVLNNAQKTLGNTTKSTTQTQVMLGQAVGHTERLQRTATQTTAGHVLQTQAMSRAAGVGTAAMRGLGLAFRGLMAATGVGLAISAVTLAIEKFIGKSADATNAANEFAQVQDVLKQSMEADSARVKETLADYQKLEAQISSGNYTSEDLERHTEVSREMAQLFPDLVAGSEQYGTSLSNQQGTMQSRVDLMERELEIERENARLKANEARQEIIDTGLESEIKLEKELADLRQSRQGDAGALQFNFDDGVLNNLNEQISKVENINELEKIQAQLLEHKRNLQQNNPEEYAQQEHWINRMTQSIDENMQSMQQLNYEALLGTNATAEQFVNNIASITQRTEGLGDNATRMFGMIGNQLVALNMGADNTGDAFERLETSLTQDTGFQQKMASYETAVENFHNATTDEQKFSALQNIKTAYEDMAASIRDSLSNTNMSDDQIASVINQLEAQIDSVLGVKDAMGDASNSVEDMIALQNIVDGEMGSTTDTIDGQTTALEDNAYAWQEGQEALKGFTDEMRALDGQMGTITGAMEELTENGAIDTSTFYDLVDLYPELLGMQLTEAELLDYLQDKANETYGIQNDLYNAQLADNAEMQQGMISNAEVTTREQAMKYLQDAQNFSGMQQIKTDYDKLVAAERDGNEQEVVNELGKKYGIDLSNFGDLAGKKEAVENELMTRIINQWNDYIGQMNQRAADFNVSTMGLDQETKNKRAAAMDAANFSRNTLNSALGDPAPWVSPIALTGFQGNGMFNTSYNPQQAAQTIRGAAGALDNLLPKWVDNGRGADALSNALKGTRDAADKLGNSGVGSGKKLDDFGKKAGKAGKGAAKGASDAAKAANKTAKEIKDLGIEVEQMTKSFSKQTFVLNQHEESLRKLNFQLEKQNIQTERYATHSQAYRNAIEKENKINKEKLKVMEQQEKSLARQIKSGSIKEFGLVSEDVNVAYNQYNVTQQASEGGKTTANVTQAKGGGNQGKVSPFGGMRVNYGYSPQGGGAYGRQVGFNGGRHYGIDFGGRSGTNIRTPHGGQVVSSGWSRYGGGNQVEIYNKAMDKTFTFMHMLGNLKVKKGQTVNPGDLIGQMGSTGNSTGTHLHFQVNSGRGINNSRSVNPNSYLSSGNQSWIGAQGVAKGVVASTSQNISTSEATRLGKNISEETASYLNEIEQAQLAAIERSIESHNAREENKSKVQEAREKLDQMTLERLKLMAEIRENDYKIIESQIEAFEVNRNSLNHKITQLEYSAEKKAREAGKNENSEIWRKYMNQARSEREKQLKIQEDQVKYIERTLAADARRSASNRMNQAHRFQLEETLRDAKEQVISLKRAVDEADQSLMDSRVNQSIKEMDDALRKIDDRMTLIEHRRHFMDSTYEKGTKEYIKNLREEIKEHDKRTNELNKQIKSLKTLRSNLKQYPDLYEQVNEKIRESEQGLRDAKTAAYDLNKEIKTLELDKSFDKLNDNLDKSKKRFDELQQLLQRINKEGQPDLYFNTQADSLKQMKEYSKVIDTNIKELEKMEKTLKGYPELHKRVTDELKNWKEQQNQVRQEMHTLRAEFSSSFVESIKQIYQTQQRLATEAIDKEYSEYEKMINKKLELIDKEAQEDQYNEDIADRQEAIQKLREEIAQRMGDDSLQNQRRLKELREELDNAEKDYNKTVENKERERRKEALQDELTDAKELADDKKENTNKMFEDMLNDQRKFNEIQEEIMQGNIDKYKGMYAELTKFINSNVKDIGKSISEGLIDGITTPFEALERIAELLKTITNDDVDVPISGLRPILETPDSTLSDMINGLNQNTPLLNFNSTPSIPSLDTKASSTINTNSNNTHTFSSLINIEKFNGTKKDIDNLQKSLEDELRKHGMVVK